MNFRDSLKTILKETLSFEQINIEPGNVIYATSLGFNDEKKHIVKAFTDYVVSHLNLKKTPKVSFVAERVNGMTTGAYNPSSDTIYVLAKGRMLADVLRTLAHELVHAMQRETGKFKVGQSIQKAGGPIEDEANAKAGELLKTFVRDLKMDVIYSL